MSSRLPDRGERDKDRRDDKDRPRDRDRDRDRYRSSRRSSRSRSPRRDGDRDRDRRRDYDRRDGRDTRDRRDRDRDDRDRRDSRDYPRDYDRGRDRDKDKDKDRRRTSDRERSRERDPEKKRAPVSPVANSRPSPSDASRDSTIPPAAKPGPDESMNGNGPAEDDEGEIIEDQPAEDPAMMAMMGFGGFGTTHGKEVRGNQEGGVDIKKQRTWRQYMNRRGGFNRPLDKIK